MIGGPNKHWKRPEAGHLYTCIDTYIFLFREAAELMDPSGRADALLSCWRLQLIMQLDQSMDGSMDRSPGPLEAREAMDHNVSLSEEPEPEGSSPFACPRGPPLTRLCLMDQ